MYKYFELKQDTGKPYILANENEKPNINEFKSIPFCESGNCKAYQDEIKEWQSKNVRIEFASSLEFDKTALYLAKEGKLSPDFNELKNGLPINCVEVKCTGCDNNKVIDKKYLACCPDSHYKAYFKNPDQPKERLYTEEEEKQVWRELINECRWYDGTPQGLTLLTNHLKGKYNLTLKKTSKMSPQDKAKELVDKLVNITLNLKKNINTGGK